jgi:hypothetical protein
VHELIQTVVQESQNLVIGISVRAQMWFEIPNHDRSIKRARHQLFHIRIEYNTGYCVLMASKRSFQSRIVSHDKEDLTNECSVSSRLCEFVENSTTGQYYECDRFR